MRTPLILRIFLGFLLGSAIGIALWAVSTGAEKPFAVELARYVSPFGTIFVNMLKMIVIPVVFFSLVVGAASLPVRKFGRVGTKVIGWYLLTSLLAALVGVALALVVNPGAGAGLDNWQDMAGALGGEAAQIAGQSAAGQSLVGVFLNLFKNPFEALATGNFLPMIVFAILFGLAVRVSIEATADERVTRRMEAVIEFFLAMRDAMFRMVDWILEYAPIGVLALSIVNFGLYGPKIVGPYVSVALGVVGGILLMVFVVYSAMIWLVTRQNPLRVLRRIREAMVTAFVTRSSAATLPVSMKVAAEELRVRDELAGFSLPLGATINMDGVCVHLPMFALLAANLFGLHLTAADLFVLVVTTVLAAVGAGGVPGGSLMLMFIILEALGLGSQQIAVVVALALGVNPILDMFETMNNVTGDLVCTHVVAQTEGLVQPPGGGAGAA
ncbi:MAG: dicarboxylate/amino acid:cation symporter [Planctomycetes bacterium]|nr:dicarboxylate/amino acid:cation symporter [Planctomycetota bacterium]